MTVTRVLVATDADRVWAEVDAALADETTEVFRVRAGRDVGPAIEKTSPDLVVLDLQIGNAGGIATSIALRQDQDMDRLPDFSILMLLDRSADVHMATFARADGWLVKPLDALRLRSAAKAALSSSSVT